MLIVRPPQWNKACLNHKEKECQYPGVMLDYKSKKKKIGLKLWYKLPCRFNDSATKGTDDSHTSLPS